MTASGHGVPANAAPSVWRDPAAWARAADFVAVLVALSLPWSTSLVSIFLVIWILVVAPSIDPGNFLRSLKRPACMLPVALFVLAAVGTLWSPASWSMRMYYVGPTAKLLVLPLLIHHFERSDNGLRVVTAFLASCTVLLLASWTFYAYLPLVLNLARGMGFSPQDYVIGLPVKNYITQSQEFVICAFGCAIASAVMWQRHRKRWSAGFAALCLGFLLNPLFVISARTALVCIPALAAVFAIKYLSRRASLFAALAMTAILATTWASSPYLRMRIEVAVTDYKDYMHSNNRVAENSPGERLEFWRKSLKFLRAAPLIGHGTGSVRGLFEQEAVGQTGISAEVINNPHNQMLYFGIQWGAVGMALLLAMWIVHFSMFRGEGWGAWIGTLVVVQNVVGSIFNSHLSDFVEGWIYVMGVGIAGGMAMGIASHDRLKNRSDRSSPPR